MMGFVDYEHWFITDGEMVIEFGGGAVLDNMVIVHNNPKDAYTIDDEFVMTKDVKIRMIQVCGMTNYSLALRNCEHVSRYIQSGVWVSFQMSETGPLRSIFYKHMSQYTKEINKIPPELKPAEKVPVQMYNGLPRAIRLTCSKGTLTKADDDNFNIVFLGPTGAGKSTLINILFNATVNKYGGSAKSVTKELNISRGEFTQITKDNKKEMFKTNVIDTIGFCDSIFTAKQVLTMTQTSVKVNVCHIDKVIIVCSGRIEGEHAKAIKQFMSWLQYDEYKQNFVFIYNKADGLSIADKTQSILDMSELLGASQTNGTVRKEKQRNNETIADVKVKYNLALGFPPGAPIETMQDDYWKLVNAACLPTDTNSKRIPLDENICTIL